MEMPQRLVPTQTNPTLARTQNLPRSPFSHPPPPSIQPAPAPPPAGPLRLASRSVRADTLGRPRPRRGELQPSPGSRRTRRRRGGAPHRGRAPPRPFYARSRSSGSAARSARRRARPCRNPRAPLRRPHLPTSPTCSSATLLQIPAVTILVRDRRKRGVEGGVLLHKAQLRWPRDLRRAPSARPPKQAGAAPRLCRLSAAGLGACTC